MAVDLGLKGRVVLVTAASKGLGKACALEFAREGAELAMCSRDEAAVAATAEEIRRETGARVTAMRADVTDPQDVSRFIASAAGEFGRIDSLVCNAGGPPAGGFEAISDEQWLKAVDLNLLSVIRLIRAALPYLKKSGAGRVVTIASSSVKQPLEGLIASNTLRLGLHGLIKSCADEFAPDHILLNTVGPGRIATDRMIAVDRAWAQASGSTIEEQTDKTRKTIPLGRYGLPAEFAKYVVLLGSPANTYVTGQALMVDGGLTRSY
jgi:3-oxoacyl-[acyl-carrier protein] reductase